jgi:predicted DNA-binding protein (MmcQ/YjbR family)
MPKQQSVDTALAELRNFGLRYPGAHLKSPWPGHLDLAVKDKTFAYLSAPGEPFSISCKLPQSNALALALPFTEPTAYALGRSGWVSARPPAGEPLPLEMFKAWIDESYRAQAPKKLVAALAGSPGSSGAKGGSAGAEPRASRRRPRAKAAPKQLPRKSKPKQVAKQPATKQPAAKQSAAKQSAAKQRGRARA